MSSERIITKLNIIDRLNQGERLKYLFFWGHQPNNDGSVGKSCLSQWYKVSFELDGIHYKTAEHYMMAEKARLFGDERILTKITNSSHPGEAKKLGRQVRGFQEKLWLENRMAIVIRGNLGKFSQNKDLQAFLLNTGDRILVEASPRDRIWGIGLSENAPEIENPYFWKGLNLLGFALMEVRRLIR